MEEIRFDDVDLHESYAHPGAIRYTPPTAKPVFPEASINEHHEHLSEEFIERVKLFFDLDLRVKSYSIRTNWGNEETFQYAVDDKTTLEVKVSKTP